MTFCIIHLDDTTERDPPITALDRLYDELGGDGEQSDSVSVLHQSGWMLDLHRDGKLELTHRFRESRHARNLRRHRVIVLWRHLAAGEIDALRKQVWQKGDGFFPSPQQDLTGEQWVRARAVYRTIGPLLGMRYGLFEFVHLRRGNVEEILSHWERIAAAFLSYATCHSLTNHQEQKLLSDLREIGNDEARAVAAGHAYWDALAATFRAADKLDVPAAKGETLADFPGSQSERSWQRSLQTFRDLKRLRRAAKKNKNQAAATD